MRWCRFSKVVTYAAKNLRNPDLKIIYRARTAWDIWTNSYNSPADIQGFGYEDMVHQVRIFILVHENN